MKIMVLSEKKIPKSNIFINREKLQQTDKVWLFGQYHHIGLQKRIILAKKAFMDRKKIFTDKYLNISLKVRPLKCFVGRWCCTDLTAGPSVRITRKVRQLKCDSTAECFMWPGWRKFQIKICWSHCKEEWARETCPRRKSGWQEAKGRQRMN